MTARVLILGSLLLINMAFPHPARAQHRMTDLAYSEVEFPEIFQNQGEEPRTPVAESMKRADDAGRQSLNLLQEKKPFSGLYISGDYVQSLDDNQSGYSYGLEWELYDRGRDEAKRDLNKTKLESQLQILQMFNQMRTRQLDEKIYFIHRIEDTTDHYVNELKSRRISEIVTQAEEKFKSGYLTRSEIEDWRLRLANTRELSRYYSTAEKVTLHPQTLALLNRFQQTDLKRVETLLQTARRHSTDLKIQELLKQRSQFFPRWRDNVSLRLFLERRHELSRQSDDVAGVRIRLPIGSNSKRKDIVHHQQQAYQEQSSAIVARLNQRIRYLHSQYYFHRARIRRQKNEMATLERKLQIQEEYSKKSVASLEYTPDKTILTLELRRLDLYQEALLTRLKMYSVTTELESLVVPDNFTDLFLSR